MPRYWLDSNVLIEAHRRAYPMSIATSFWTWLAGQVQQGYVVAPRRVYQEIAEVENHKDELAQWVKNRRDKGLCIAPSKAVQKRVGEIEVNVFQVYEEAEAWDFSRGADPWVIAHALEDAGVVVTKESDLRPEAKKVRIPDVCKIFDVKCVDTLEMMKLLKAKF
ncbi:MAG TPA: DUF4411 family protein [Candidatus Dormibacteraeota bacterium]|jgi:hypothetical protein|nr:DUF4411 family protein [Candidatus Dormibacteraeota bacterium]